MTYTGYSTGEQGSVGIATSWKPGDGTDPNAVVAPTSFVMAEAISLDSQPAMVEHNVYSQSRDSDRGYRTGKYKVGGTVGLALYPTNGLELMIGSLGKDIFTAKGTPDTIATITTANGVSTITLTTGTLPLTPPCLVIIGTGAAQEPRPVISWNAGTKTVEVPACSIVHAAGDAFNTLDQLATQPYTETDGYGNQLRRLSIEENLGNKYSYAYPGSLVSKWDLKATAAKIDVTATIAGNAQRIKQATPTAFVEDASWNELSYEFTDGFLVCPADPTDTGSATTQLLTDGEDWEISLDNKLIVKTPYDGTEVERNFPGQRMVDLKFQVLTEASRPVYYQDFLAKNLDLPWMAFAALNIGTSGTPSWQAMLFYAPNCRVTKSTEVRGLQDVIGESVELRARKANGQEKLYVVASAPSITAAI